MKIPVENGLFPLPRGLWPFSMRRHVAFGSSFATVTAAATPAKPSQRQGRRSLHPIRTHRRTRRRAARATGGTLRAATHKSHAREPSNHKRCPRCLHERPSALICRHKISSPETAQSLHATICYHAQVRSCEKTEGSETPVFGQFWKSRISGCDQKQGKQRFEQGKLNAFSAE